MAISSNVQGDKVIVCILIVRWIHSMWYLKNDLKEFLQIWYKYSLGLNDEVIRFFCGQRSKVKVKLALWNAIKESIHIRYKH